MKRSILRRPVTLTRRLTVILALFIALAAAAAIFPAYLIVRSELETQIGYRLDDAVAQSTTILELEHDQLQNEVTLAAQRPTLLELLGANDHDGLQAYLRNFQQSTPLDALYVTDPAGQVVAGETPPADDPLRMSFSAAASNLGLVTGSVALDGARLHSQTEFVYQFAPGGTAGESFQRIDGGQLYYGERVLLQGIANGATMEVLLPVGGMLASETQVVGVLGVTTLAVALAAALIGGLYIRRSLRPLSTLIAAARRLESGDLTTPVQVVSIVPEIRLLADAIERSRQQQAYFLASVSHEFRTPLAGMRVSLELLLENARYLSAVELNELLKSLALSASSLQNLVDNLLESSKIEASHFALRLQRRDFNPILGEALRLVQPFLNRRQQPLMLDEPLALPPLKFDPTRVTQVLVNLLSNASKYSPMNTPIDIAIDLREQALYVAVADRGPGIPDGQREAIFRRFFRLGGSDHGTGLGLAVVKGIVEAHGGKVGVEAREGGGSIFWFTLPVEEAS